MEYTFPDELAIAYAVCQQCNHREFIVNGQTQVCNNCNEIMFRTKERRYNLSTMKQSIPQEKVTNNIGIIFPNIIDVSDAHCNTDNCNYVEYVVQKEKVICQYCMQQMVLKETKIYTLNNETFQCPICESNRLYFPPYENNGIGSYEECPNCKFQFTFYDEKELSRYKDKYIKRINSRKD